MKKRLPDRRLELEKVLRGVAYCFICVFIPPIIVTVIILTGAMLNTGQGSLASVPFPEDFWKNLLSFSFRISLVPGIVYLTYRGLSRLRERRGEKRLALVLVSLMLFTVLVVMPPGQQHGTLSRIASKSQLLRAVYYKTDSRQPVVVNKEIPVKSSRPQRSQPEILTKKLITQQPPI